ncbi:IS5 family transposase [Spirosoma sp. BT702]|uniref:IS5 family transposase n=1 Tax=Spirosoma profusum TaxID=2771354 RepID=A0A927AQE3_9BACT|nr:IS5 family transposase [Spirosoma profusum]MBD2700258.1 IS5 family transposase [Spirosoma profusum]
MRTQFVELPDAHWQVIKNCIDSGRKRRVNLRTVVNAIRWLTHTGCQWRNMTANYPPWQTVYYYFRQWQQDGRWQQLLLQLVALERERQGREAQPSRLAVDSQSVRKGLWVSEETGLDGNKRVNGRKRHLAVDSLGLPVAIYVSAANLADGQAGKELLWQLDGLDQRLALIMADKAYRGEFEEAASWCGYRVEISQRPESAQGFVPQRGRWQVERSFAWLNVYRRLSRDYEKTSASSEAFLRVAYVDLILARN